MDITDTIAPKSDQQNAEDYLAGPRTFTVSECRVVGGEQPVEVHLVEAPGRPYKPSKTMRRVLVKVWGADSGQYAGRRLTLYCDPEVKFGGQKVGGIKISNLSHIDKRADISLTITRGKKAVHTVQPLTEAPAAPAAPEPTAEEVAACTDVDELRGMWNAAGPELRAVIEARRAEITGADS